MTVGMIYFALVDAGIPFDDSIHNVQDEQLFNITIQQSEGDFASAELEIVNPGAGLLNPARKKRCFISYQDGAVIKLLFSGRIVGFPTDFSDETVKLTYIAQPEDWQADQATFLNTLKTAPFYNELLIAEDSRNEPAEILAARSGLLYWDRATNAISLSDIIEGSAELDIGTTAIFDSISINMGDPPVTSINIIVEVQWEQFGVGVVDCASLIKAEFINSAIGTEQINTLTPLSFEDAWKGVAIPNGYTVIESKLTPVANGFGLAPANIRSDIINVNAADFPTSTGGVAGTRPVDVPRVWYEPTLKLQAVYEQKRRELFATQLSADVQDFSLRGDKTEDLSLRLQDPTAIAQAQILNAKLPSFYYNNIGVLFTTFGADIIENALLRGSARLKYANRVVETTFEGDLDTLINVTTDYTIRLEDSRLPGGSIRGKVVNYNIGIDGSTGQTYSKITILSCIGLGLDAVPNLTPTEAEVGLIIYDNEYGAATMNSSIFYDLAAAPIIDEPIDVVQMEADNEYLINNVNVDKDGEVQVAGFLAENITAPELGGGRPDTYLTDNPTEIQVDLKSMNPASELFKEILITTTNLTLPKHVNMEA